MKTAHLSSFASHDLHKTLAVIRRDFDHRTADFLNRVYQDFKGVLPSRRELERVHGYGRYTLDKILANLKSAGLVFFEVVRAGGKFLSRWIMNGAPESVNSTAAGLQRAENQSINTFKTLNKKLTNIDPPPKPPEIEQHVTTPATVKTGGDDDKLIDQFLSNYPKAIGAAEADSARLKLKAMRVNNLGDFLTKLINDCTERKAKCWYWREERYIPYINNYLIGQVWDRAYMDYPVKTPYSAPQGQSKRTTELTLHDELTNRDWAL